MKKISFSIPEEILSEKESGSTELLEQINDFLKNHYYKFTDLSGTISKLQKHFTSFQNIQAYLSELQRLIDNRKLTVNFFSDFKSSSGIFFDSVYKNALPYLLGKKVILTISNSKTVFEILKRMNARNKLKVIVCESRPRLEGRSLAQKLVKKKISVELITEAMSADYVRKSNCVLIGADTVLKNKNIVNKVGSLQLALLCKQFQKSFYVLTDKSKFSRKNIFRHRIESPAEIWKRSPNDIGIRNIYFEEIPNFLISRIITQ